MKLFYQLFAVASIQGQLIDFFKERLFYWKIESSFFNLKPEILAELFNLIYVVTISLEKIY